MPYEVTVSVKEIANLALQMNKAGAQIRTAIVNALNRAGGTGFTQVKRTLAAQTGVKQSDLIHGAEGIRPNKATPSTMEYDVVARSSTTPLSYFAPRQQQPGVSAAPWGQRRIFNGTFLATMKSGHVGVWAHAPGPPIYAKRISPTTGRVYYSQVNLKQLWGPSIAKEMIKEPTPSEFKRVATEAFTKRLNHELGRLMSSITPSDPGFSPKAQD